MISVPSIRRTLPLAGFLLFALPGVAVTPVKTLSGTVTDSSHQPIHGAVVKLRNTNDSVVRSYLSDADGGYHFKHLDDKQDYQVWATWHGKKSSTERISKFNMDTTPSISLTVDTK